VGAKGQPGAVCARCGQKLALAEEPIVAHVIGLAPAAEHGLDLNAAPVPRTIHPTFDQWQVDESVRRLQARIAPWQESKQPLPAGEAEANRESRWHVHAAHSEPPEPHVYKPRASARSATVPRLTTWFGLTVFACGAFLLTWSFVEDRLELWTAGVPITVVGQIILLIGLALQLERVWQNSQAAVRRLQLVDSQLDRLERSTNLMCSTGGASGFYAHMAQQASPHMLVANLKGQLDLLAESMAKRGD
jgi:hypothetical protein